MSYDHLIGRGYHRWTHGTYTPGQIDFMADTESPSILYSGAYRAGKTEIACRGVIRHALAYPYSRVGVFRAKLKSLKQSTLRTLLELVHPSWVADWNNSELELRLINGASIPFLGCDFADRIGSIELSAGFIDEAHEVSPESYGMIVGRMSAPIYVDEEWLKNVPQFADYARAAVNIRQLWLACNPKSQGHWLYKDFLDPDTALPGRKYYSSNTITNRNLPDSYLTQNLAQYARPGVDWDRLAHEIELVRKGEADADGMHLQPLLTPFGQRNLLGLWVAAEGAVYELDVATQFGDRPKWGDPLGYYAGVDFGYHHPRIVLAELCPDNRLWAKGYWHSKNSDPLEMVEALQQIHRQVGLKGVFMPHDQPGITKMARKALGAGRVLKADNKVLAGIGSVQTALNRGLLKFSSSNLEGLPPDSPGLFWAEMEGYVWKRDKDGQYLDEPEKADDHYPDALRYLVHSLVKLNKLSLVARPQQEAETEIVDEWFESLRPRY